MSPNTSPPGGVATNLLSRLVDRQRNPVPALRPLLPSRFEPAESTGLGVADPEGGDGQMEVEVDEPAAWQPAPGPRRHHAPQGELLAQTMVHGTPRQAPTTQTVAEQRPRPGLSTPPLEHGPRRPQTPPDDPVRQITGPGSPSRHAAPPRSPSPLVAVEERTSPPPPPTPASVGGYTAEPPASPPAGLWLPEPAVVIAPQALAGQIAATGGAQPATSVRQPYAPQPLVEQPITLSIRIGRVEVRTPAPAPAATPAEPRTVQQPRLSLDDYLARPNRGRS